MLSLLGQQQQFHFAFGQRPFHFSTDPLSGFRMPPIGNCQSKYYPPTPPPHYPHIHQFIITVQYIIRTSCFLSSLLNWFLLNTSVMANLIAQNKRVELEGFRNWRRGRGGKGEAVRLCGTPQCNRIKSHKTIRWQPWATTAIAATIY